MKNVILFFLFAILTFTAAVSAQSDGVEGQANSLVEEIGAFDFENPAEQIVHFCFLDGGTKLWLLGTNSVQIWDIRNKKVLSSVRHGIDELSNYTFKRLSPDGGKLFFMRRKHLSLGDLMTAYVFDLNTFKRLKEFDPETFKNGEWSKDGKTFITISDGGKPDPKKDVKNSLVSFWDGETLEPRKTITVPDLEWWYLSPNGNQFYTTSVPTKKGFFSIPYSNGMTNLVTVWNMKTGRIEKNLSVGGEEFAVLTWKLTPSPSGRYMAMVSKHRTKDEEHKILFWELNGSDLPKFTIKANPRIRDSGISYSPDEKFFAIDSGKNIQIYRSDTGEKKGEVLNADLPYYWALDNQIVFNANPAMLNAYNVANGGLIYQNPLIYESYDNTQTDGAGQTISSETVVTDSTSVVPHPDGNMFLTHSNQFVRLYKAQNGELVETLARPPFSVVKQKYSIRTKRYVADAGWSDNGKMLYVINYEKNILTLWDLRNINQP